MSLRLFEGIVVDPSGGRRAKSLGLVPGIRVSSVQEATIEIETIPATIELNQQYPFRVRIGEHLRLKGAEPPYDINMIRATEYTESVLQRPWDPEDPFVTMDAQGVITYTPTGGYVGNVLIIEVAVADANAPPKVPTQQRGEVYRNPDAPPADEVEDPNTKMVLVEVEGGIVIGEPEAAEQYWEHQGNNGTCMLYALAGIIAATGIDIDPLLLMARMTEGFGLIPDILGPDGNPMYRLYTEAERAELEALYPPEQYGFADGGYLLPAVWPVRGYSRNDVMVAVMDAFDVPYRHRNSTGFVDIVEELLAGNKVFVSIDSDELWNNKVIRGSVLRAEEDAYVQEVLDEWTRTGDAHLFTPEFEQQLRESFRNSLPLVSANHAVWVTGIEFPDGGDPVVIINDSAQGAGDRIPLDVFLSAWEDSEYFYIATGAEQPVSETRQALRENKKTVSDVLADFSAIAQGLREHPDPEVTRRVIEAYTAVQDQRQTDFPRIIAREVNVVATLLPTLELLHPGITEVFREWKNLYEAGRNATLAALGLTLEQIEDIVDLFKDVDIE